MDVRIGFELTRLDALGHRLMGLTLLQPMIEHVVLDTR